MERRELQCESCGATLVFEPGGLSSSCPFCASNRIRVGDAEDVGLRAKFLIPFQIERDDLVGPVKKWLNEGWIHPSDLRAAGNVEGFTGIYMPFWTFSSDLKAEWEAEVGHREHYQEYDSSSGVYVTKTRTVWRWESGQVQRHLENWDIAGTDKLSRILLEKLRPWDFAAFVPFSGDYLSGWPAQMYDVGLLEAWDLGKAAMREEVHRDCLTRQSTPQVRNFSMVCDLDDEVWRYVLLPVWVSIYTYDGVVHQVLVNGQTGEVVGSKPVAWWKVWLAIALVFSPGVGLILISIPLIFLGGLGIFTMILGIVITILPFIWATPLYYRAVAAERT